VTTKRDNALLDRTEVYFTIAHAGSGTPSRSEIKKALAGTLNAKGVVVLDWARSEFGATSTRGYAKVYPSKERAMQLETPPILIRNGLLAAVKKEAPPAEGAPVVPAKKEAKPEAAPKPEKPKEEPKAPPKEEKKEAPRAPAKEEKKEPKGKEPEKKEAPKPAAKEEKKAEAPKEKKPSGKKEGK